MRELSDFNLRRAMQELYRTGAYYASIPAKKVDYEENYWGEIVDPDGRRRDRTKEREMHLSDLVTELAFVNKLQGGRVLDIGCGLGWLLSALDDRWEKFGIEISAFAAERARVSADVFIGPLLDFPVRPAFFDLIVMHHVIEHMENPEANIKRVAELMKKGSHLILGTPDFDSACARRFGVKFRLLNDPTHVSLFSNESMHRFLRDHGFTIIDVDYPYFSTRHFTLENLGRLFDASQVSPPFYGNFMTFYCVRD